MVRDSIQVERKPRNDSKREADRRKGSLECISAKTGLGELGDQLFHQVLVHNYSKRWRKR